LVNILLKWQIDKPFWGGIISDTNPPDTDHWLYNYFEVDKIEGTTLFRQPPGLIKDENNQWKDNPEADNVENLAKMITIMTMPDRISLEKRS